MNCLLGDNITLHVILRRGSEWTSPVLNGSRAAREKITEESVEKGGGVRSENRVQTKRSMQARRPF